MRLTERTQARIPQESSLDMHRTSKQTEVHVPDSDSCGILVGHAPSQA